MADQSDADGARIFSRWTNLVAPGQRGGAGAASGVRARGGPPGPLRQRADPRSDQTSGAGAAPRPDSPQHAQ
eukprot:459022-Pyramimonas_sp.AAC.1